jgi:hypothetical protein
LYTPKIVPPVGHMFRVRNLEYDVFLLRKAFCPCFCRLAPHLRHMHTKTGLAAPPRCPACTFSVVLVGFCVF